jgi:hypothetical protein
MTDELVFCSAGRVGPCNADVSRNSPPTCSAAARPCFAPAGAAALHLGPRLAQSSVWGWGGRRRGRDCGDVLTGCSGHDPPVMRQREEEGISTEKYDQTHPALLAAAPGQLAAVCSVGHARVCLGCRHLRNLLLPGGAPKLLLQQLLLLGRQQSLMVRIHNLLRWDGGLLSLPARQQVVLIPEKVGPQVGACCPQRPTSAVAWLGPRPSHAAAEVICVSI